MPVEDRDVFRRRPRVEGHPPRLAVLPRPEGAVQLSGLSPRRPRPHDLLRVLPARAGTAAIDAPGRPADSLAAPASAFRLDWWDVPWRSTGGAPKDHPRVHGAERGGTRRATLVATDDDGHSRRADLFIAVDKTRLVSIEFKYLRAKSRPAVPACVRQIRQHLTKHRACVLVLYVATPVSEGLEADTQEIRESLSRVNGFVVRVDGPPVVFC